MAVEQSRERRGRHIVNRSRLDSIFSNSGSPLAAAAAGGEDRLQAILAAFLQPFIVLLPYPFLDNNQ